MTDDTARLRGPGAPYTGPRQGGGIGGREGGSVRIFDDGDVQHARLGKLHGGYTTPALESLFRTEANPTGLLVPSIPQALQNNPRNKPAAGSQWYKEMVKAGVHPNEIKTFGLADLESSSEEIGKQEIIDRVNATTNELNAQNAGSGVAPLQREAVPEDYRRGYEYATAPPEFYRETLPDMFERAVSDNIGPDALEFIRNEPRYTEVLDNLTGSLSPAAQEPGWRPFDEFRTARSEMEYLMQDLGLDEDTNMLVFDELDQVYEQLVKYDDYARRMGPDAEVAKHAKVGPFSTPQFHTGYKPRKDALGNVTTRYALPEREYGYPDLRGYTSGSYPGRLERDYPDIIKSTGPVSHFTGPTRELPGLQFGERMFDDSHARPTIQAVRRPYGTWNERGELTFDTQWNLAETQRDPSGKEQKMGGIGMLYPRTDADMQRMEEIPELIRQLRVQTSEIDDAWRASALNIDDEWRRGDIGDEELRQRKNALQNQMRSQKEALRREAERLTQEQQDLEDRGFLGMPEGPWPTERLWPQMHIKHGIQEAIRGGHEYVTLPPVQGLAQANDSLTEYQQLLYDPRTERYLNERGETINKERLEGQPAGWPDQSLPEETLNEIKKRGDIAWSKFQQEGIPQLREMMLQQQLNRTKSIASRWTHPRSGQTFETKESAVNDYLLFMPEDREIAERLVEKNKFAGIKDRWGDTDWYRIPSNVADSINTPEEYAEWKTDYDIGKMDEYDLNREMERHGVSYPDYAKKNSYMFPQEGYMVNERGTAWTTKFLEQTQSRALEDTLRSVGLEGKVDIEDVPSPSDTGNVPWTTKGIRITPEVKERWAQGVPMFSELPKPKQPKKGGKPNPGKIMGAYKQGKITREQAEQQLLDAGVPAERIGNMLR
jgi:hypothetical protein